MRTMGQLYEYVPPAGDAYYPILVMGWTSSSTSQGRRANGWMVEIPSALRLSLSGMVEIDTFEDAIRTIAEMIDDETEDGVRSRLIEVRGYTDDP